MTTMLRTALIGLMISLALPTVAAQADLGESPFVYRYKFDTLKPSDEPSPEDPDWQNKEIVAYYAGAAGFELSGKLPMKPDWADDAWQVTVGELPEGVEFDADRLVFEGTPAAPGEFEVSLAGYDSHGQRVGKARANFDIRAAQGQVVQVDFYGHTGKYAHREVPLPDDLSIYEWEYLKQAPKGVEVNGRYLDGTPEESGTYPILAFGRDYRGDTVATVVGSYLVEDGPTFPPIKDAVFKFPPRNTNPDGLGPIDFGAPVSYAVRPISEDASPRYFLERADARDAITECSLSNNPVAELPIGTYSNGDFTDLRINGFVRNAYDTVFLRFKARDSDGTVGCSNWFEFGSADPVPYCGGTTDPSWVTVLTGRETNIQLPSPSRVVGTLDYAVTEGELPEGLELAADGRVVGTALRTGVSEPVVVETNYTEGDASGLIGECSYVFNVKSAGLGLVDATPQQDRYVRVGQTYRGVLEVRGGIEDYEVSRVNADAWPGYAFAGSTTNTPSVAVMGVPQEAGNFTVPFELDNGDGSTADGGLTVHARSDISINHVAGFSVKRLEAARSGGFGAIPFDPLSVIPNVAEPGAYPRFSLATLGTPLPDGVRFEEDSGRFVGSTADPVGEYGPFQVTMCDFTGDCDTSNEFLVTVEPRDAIALRIAEGAPSFVVQKDEAVTVPTVESVEQPDLAKDFPVTFTLSGTLPAGLSFDPSNGNIAAAANLPRSAIDVYGPFTVTATDSEGSTAVSEEFEIIVKDWDLPQGKLPISAVRSNVTGNTADGESPTSVFIDLKKLVKEDTVIGGINAVTFVSASPASPAGLMFDADDGTISGVPTAEFNGELEITFKDGADREGVMRVPLTVLPYPSVEMTDSSYGVARLTEAGSMAEPVQATAVAGFWNEATWSWAEGFAPPAGLSVSKSEGKITGAATAPVGTVYEGLRLKAVSAGANGEELVSYTNAFSLTVIEPVPMSLGYAPEEQVFYYSEDLATYSIAPAIPAVDGSRVDPLVYSVEDFGPLSDDGVAGLAVNSETGVLTGAPGKIGKWTVSVRVTDDEGQYAVSDLKIKSTLEGGVRHDAEGGSLVVRLGEPFTTEPIGYSNAVGTPVFTYEPLALDRGLEFDASTLSFASSSFLDETGSYRVQAFAKDAHDRGFETPLMWDFWVVPPLVASMPGGVHVAEQYSIDEGFDIAFGAQAEHDLGNITWSVSGEVPGTLVYKASGASGQSLAWQDGDGDGHFAALNTDGTVAAYQVNGVSRPVDAGTPPSVILPPDALVFDKNNPSLKGVPSRAGDFAIHLVARDDYMESYSEESPSREEYNTATTAETVILRVEEAPALVATNASDAQSLNRYTDSATLRTIVENAAYGRTPTFTMLSGTLPEGVSALKGATGILYSGYPTKTGVYSNVVWRVTDVAGRSVTTSPVSFTVAERDDVLLVASANPAAASVNKEMNPVTVTADDTAWGKSVPAEDWVVSGASNLPEGVTFVIEDGRVVFSGTPAETGRFSGVTVTATDELGSTGSIPLEFVVLEPGDAIGLEIADVTIKPDYPFEVGAEATNTYGEITFYSDDIEGSFSDWMVLGAKSGLVEGEFATVGDRAVEVFVTDSTDRVTSRTMTVAVIPNLRLTVPTVVTLKQGESADEGIAVDYVLGETSFEKGAGDWPAGVSVDPDTGRITGTPSAAPGTYPGLTVRGTDRFVSVGSQFSDEQESAEFAIEVLPIDASPVIADITGGFLEFSTVGVDGVFAPTVRDSVNSKPWNYEGTVYAINRDLSGYGLAFDPDTGRISGTPTASTVIDDVVITVTSQVGDSDSTAPFKFGIRPDQPLAVASAQKTDYLFRLNSEWATDPIEVRNAGGDVTFSRPVSSFTWDNDSGAFSAEAGSQSAAWITGKDAPATYITQVADEFGRSVQFSFRVAIVGELAAAAADQSVSVGQSAYSAKPVTVSNAIGSLSYSYEGLPSGFTYDPSTGRISGDATTLSPGSAYAVTATVTDDGDGATDDANFMISAAAEAYRYWAWACTGNGGQNYPSVRTMRLFDGGANVTGSATTWSQTDESSPAYGSYAVVDSNDATVWYPASTEPESWRIVFDFGSTPRNITGVQAQSYLANFKCYSFEMQGSMDGVNYAPVWTATVPGGIPNGSLGYYAK